MVNKTSEGELTHRVSSFLILLKEESYSFFLKIENVFLIWF